MEKAAAGLLRLQPEFDRILSSPLKRAWQTAEIVKRVYGHEDPIERSPDLSPGGSFLRLISALRESQPDDAVLLVGHQPHLGELISHLVWGSRDADVPLKKGGVCHLELLLCRTASPASLRWLLTPKQLRLLGDRS
jgi:phosphohistidine phosphatase